MANKFNEFFTNVAKNVVNSIHPTDTDLKYNPPSPPPNPNPDPSFDFNSIPLTQTEVIEAIHQLKSKNSADIYGIFSNFIKKIATPISYPLFIIFKQSLLNGIVPRQLKDAKIIPLFKSGDTSVLDNYRPIALLTTFSKILEKIVCNRLTEYLENNKLVSSFQFGFRKKHSTLHPLLMFSNKITEALENKEHCIAIFCDLKKAFDTVDHNILFIKLAKLGVKGTSIKWFRRYLSERQQSVYLNNQTSEKMSITVGVPQGSILGPLLFLIYINDLPLCSEFLSLLFADDTTLLLSHSNFEFLVNWVNQELKKLSFFFRQHKLALHSLKTKFMIFSNSPIIRNSTPEITINNNNQNEFDPNLVWNLSQIMPHDNNPYIRFLGIHIDPCLSYNHHINLVQSKLSKALFIMRTAKNILTESALKSVYYALFHSNMIYCLPIWSSAAQSLLKPIEIMQKKAIRIIFNLPYNAHTEPSFKAAKILPFSNLILFFNLQIMHSYINNLLPDQFANIWPTNQERRRLIAEDQDNEDHQDINSLQNRLLRNDTHFHIKFVRLAFSLKQLIIVIPKTWNEFTDETIKNTRSKNQFNILLKQQLLNNLSTTIICNRLLCPVCHL